MSVPNQLVITVSKEKTDKQHLYSCINLEAIDYAAAYLHSIGAFKLWLYIAKNQNGYEFELSRSAFCEWSGVSPRTYSSSLDLLKEMHFLVRSPKQQNKWIFYEKPLEIEELKPEEETVIIEIPKEKQQEINITKKEWYF